MFVLSRLKSCTASTLHVSAISGTHASKSSEVMTGVKPDPLFLDAIVPPVAINKIRFIKNSAKKPPRLRRFSLLFLRVFFRFVLRRFGNGFLSAADEVSNHARNEERDDEHADRHDDDAHAAVDV